MRRLIAPRAKGTNERIEFECQEKWLDQLLEHRLERREYHEPSHLPYGVPSSSENRYQLFQCEVDPGKPG
jgi:hypothetical protein